MAVAVVLIGCMNGCMCGCNCKGGCALEVGGEGEGEGSRMWGDGNEYVGVALECTCVVGVAVIPV